MQQQEAASNALADKIEKSNAKKGETNVKNGLTEGVPERSKEMAERVDKKIDLDRSIREEAQKTQQQEKKKDQDLGL